MPFFEEIKLQYIFSERRKPDVILTNSGSMALGLRYDAKSMPAPVILFIYKNNLARKITVTGIEKNIPVFDKPELVNDLFFNSKASQYIPYKHYNDIAEIYRKIFKASGISKKNGYKKIKENYFDELCREKRNSDLEIFSIIIPEKVQLELSRNLFLLLKDRSFYADTLGFQVKNIKVKENTKLKNEEYGIKINGSTVRQGMVKYISLDPYQQICLQLKETLTVYSKEIIGRDDIVLFINQIKEKYPVLIHETMNSYSVGEIRQIICNLLEERVSIQNIPAIFETIADFSEKEHDINMITERVRIAIGRDICASIINENNSLTAICFSHEFELMIRKNTIHTDFGEILESSFLKKFQQKILEAVETAEYKNVKPVFICRLDIRKAVCNSICKFDPQLSVLSLQEVPADITVQYVLELDVP